MSCIAGKRRLRGKLVLHSVVLESFLPSSSFSRVEARFKNFGKPQRLAYDLVREGGAWRVADIRAVKKGGWVLTKLLAKR
mgnify:CR=1 FL=1